MSSQDIDFVGPASLEHFGGRDERLRIVDYVILKCFMLCVGRRRGPPDESTSVHHIL